MMANERDSSHLHSFIGKDVRMFRGGPESRSGKLLDVRSDFLTLATEEDGVVHYNLNHIKSAWRNAQNNSLLDEQVTADQSYNNPDSSINNFQELLRSLIEHQIQIDRGGPESRKGRLLDVKSDFLILDTVQDGIVFYKIQHIKSISESSEDSDQTNKSSNDQKDRWLMLRNLASVDSFNELLKKLKYNWVKVNRGGPESVEGLMADLNDECLILTVQHEVNYMQIFHIRNISVNLKSKNDQSKNGQEGGKKGEDAGASDKKDQKQDKGDKQDKKDDKKNEKDGKQDKKDDKKNEKDDKQDKKDDKQDKKDDKHDKKDDKRDKKDDKQDKKDDKHDKKDDKRDKKDDKHDKKEQEKKKGDGGDKKEEKQERQEKGKKDDPKQNDEEGKANKEKKELKYRSVSRRDSGKNGVKQNERSNDQEKRKGESEKNKDKNPPAKPWVKVLSRK